jgi:hypothetical protein
MPIPIRSRRYDARFWQQVLGNQAQPKTIAEINRSLGFETDDSD